MATSEKKVFDVGKPGSAKPETGSKPMVIGHKTLLSDPTIKPESESAEKENTEEVKKTEKSKVEIKPLSAPEAEEKPEEKAENSEEKEKQPDAPAAAESKPETEAPEEAEEKQADPEAEKEEKKKAEDDLSAEQAEKLEAMIKSKEYFVPIEESNKKAVRTFIITAVVVLLLGIVVGSLLVDAEVLDLGIDVPFDLL